MAKTQNYMTNPTKEQKPEYQQSLTVVDYIDSLIISYSQKNILKMIYSNNKELHTHQEWKPIVKS